MPRTSPVRDRGHSANLGGSADANSTAHRDARRTYPRRRGVDHARGGRRRRPGRQVRSEPGRLAAAGHRRIPRQARGGGSRSASPVASTRSRTGRCVIDVVSWPARLAPATPIRRVETSAIRAVRTNDVQLGLFPSHAFERQGVTTLRPLQAPFLITSLTHAAGVAESPASARLQAGLEQISLTGLGLVPEGLYRPFGFLKPLLVPADFDGARIRADSSRSDPRRPAGTRGPPGRPRREAGRHGRLQRLRQRRRGRPAVRRRLPTLRLHSRRRRALSQVRRHRRLEPGLEAAEARAAQGAQSERPPISRNPRGAAAAERAAAKAFCAAGGTVVVGSRRRRSVRVSRPDRATPQLLEARPGDRAAPGGNRAARSPQRDAASALRRGPGRARVHTGLRRLECGLSRIDAPGRQLSTRVHRGGAAGGGCERGRDRTERGCDDSHVLRRALPVRRRVARRDPRSVPRPARAAEQVRPARLEPENAVRRLRRDQVDAQRQRRPRDHCPRSAHGARLARAGLARYLEARRLHAASAARAGSCRQARPPACSSGSSAARSCPATATARSRGTTSAR